MINIRQFQSGDENQLREIFFHTVRQINSKDYSQSQVEAWAPEVYDVHEWQQRIKAIAPFVATVDNQIAGYADLQADGLIDHFFIHHQYQRKGIGKALMFAIFELATKRQHTKLYSHVSITAKPFFEHFGFSVVREQQVNIREQVLTNFLMEKVIAN